MDFESASSPQPGTSDGFQTVTRGKKRTRAVESRSSTTKQTKSATASRPQVVVTPESDSARRVTPPPRPKPAPAPKAAAPPPLILQEKTAWNRVSQALQANKINYTHARNVAHGIQIKVATPGDHRALSAYLRKENIGFHTYALQEDRELRVVIRGVPKELDIDYIKEDLTAQSLPLVSVHRMHSGRGKQPYNMILVALEPTPEAKKKIACLTTICGLSGISIEAPHKRGTPGQCYRCQLYGHSARNCHARPRCVKCLGDHATIDCVRDRETATEPPSCVLCLKQGHPANYRGCPRAPRKRSTLPAPRTVGPKTSAPSVPKPAFVPAAVPTVSAWKKPLPYTKAGTETAPPPPLVTRPAPQPLLAPRPAPAFRPPQPSAVNDFALVRDFVTAVNFDRLRSFADAIRRSVTPEQRLAAAFDHMDVYESVSRTL
ncbi:hypothetical protein F3G63_34165 [Pseudomonas aeruginosa]|nr:hypothetical protein F3G63_34165 [Pseudomonas aeruginosa]